MHTEILQLLLQQVNAHGNSATATKLQTARNIKLQGAVSGNKDFDGSGNITIDTEMSNIAILYAEVTTPQAGESNLNAQTSINYPDGYSSQNCVVISLMSKQKSDQNGFNTTMSPSVTSRMLGCSDLQATLNTENISIRMRKIDTNEASRTCTCRLVLMKIL